MSDMINKFNTSSVALKNVFWFLGGVVFLVLSWANTDSHMKDTELHLTPTNSHIVNNEIHLTPLARAKLIILLDDFDELVERVEKKDGRVNEKVNEMKADIKDIRKYLFNNK